MTVSKRTKRPKPPAELVQLADSLLANYTKPEDLIGENGLLKQLTKMLVERALEVEMAAHLGHDKSDAIPTSLAMHATATAPRHSKATLANCPSIFRVTGKRRSNLNSSPSIKRAGPAS